MEYSAIYVLSVLEWIRQCRGNSFLSKLGEMGRITILGCSTLIIYSLLATPFSRAASTAAGERPLITISGIVNEQTHAVAKEVLRVAYNRIGCRVRFEFVPGIRSLQMANRGKTDGDIARIAGTEQQYPNLIPLSTPVIHFQAVAFTKSVTRQIDSWDDLQGLKVGIIRGIRYSTIQAKTLHPFFAEDMTHLFRLLDNDRIEIAVAVFNAGTIELGKNFSNSGIHVIGKPLYQAPLYHFIHKKNSYLKDDLEKELKKMAAQGEIELILKAARTRLMQR